SDGLLRAAVPRGEQPHALVLLRDDLPERLASGRELVLGSSSPRRASFVPDFLARMLPRHGAANPQVRLADLRGNVDSRLRRLHQPRGGAAHLDGIVLAFAGLAPLAADPSSRAMLRELVSPRRRMLLPRSTCRAARAQGALAIECRADDARTAALLRAIDDPPTRRAVELERALLAERGGGCHQRFGATQIELPILGSL